MKAVILAGGLGTRLSEETHVMPKPMVKIGDMPIIWHIMSIYAKAGIKEFIVCAGFKQEVIKNYFLNFSSVQSDVEIDLFTGAVRVLKNNSKDWKVTVVDTGINTLTGGRLARVRDLIGDETFCMTYGDGVSDIDISDLVSFHRSHDKIATVTAVRAPGRFGDLKLQDDIVTSFSEKDEGNTTRINGGFFVLEPEVLNNIDNDEVVWEDRPMRDLANNGDLMAYVFEGFWQPMDTLKDKRFLDKLFYDGKANWL